MKNKVNKLFFFRNYFYVTTEQVTVSSLQAMKAQGDVDARFHIYAATTLGKHRMAYLYAWVHRCGTSGSMRACHAAGPGSIPVGTSLLVEIFSGFFLTCKTNVRKL